MLRIICAVVVACTIMVSCNSAPHNGILTIDVGEAIDGGTQKVNLSGYVSELDYIALKSDSVFMPSYRQFNLVPTESGFVFTPKMGRNPLFYYDASGKLVNHFSRIGRAYGEHQTVRMSQYDEMSDRFSVVDLSGKVLVYTLAGDFLYEISTDSLADYTKVHNFLNLDGNMYILSRKKDMLSLDALGVDSLGRVKCGQELLSYKEADKYDTPEIIFCYDNTARIIHKSVDTIFSVNSGLEVAPVYALNLGSYKDGENRKIGVGGMVQGETDSFVLLQTTHKTEYFDNIDAKERINCILYDKKNETAILMAKDQAGEAGFENDLDGGAAFIPKTICKNKMYQVIDAVKFIEFAEKSNSEKMKKVAATLTEESNPVIVVATLKN